MAALSLAVLGVVAGAALAQSPSDDVLGKIARPVAGTG